MITNYNDMCFNFAPGKSFRDKSVQAAWCPIAQDMYGPDYVTPATRLRLAVALSRSAGDPTDFSLYAYRYGDQLL